MAAIKTNIHDARRIVNPFRDMAEDEVDVMAQQLTSDHGLDVYKATFVKAGRILRDPKAWQYAEMDDVEELNPEEQQDLQQEALDVRRLQTASHFWQASFWTGGSWKSGPWTSTFWSKGFWNQPKELRATIITLCVAAVVQGWNQAVINGANLGWPVSLGLQYPDDFSKGGPDPWIFAAVNAAPYLSAAVFALLLSDPANEVFFGRRAAICASATLILAASIGGAFSHRIWVLAVCRAILGIGMGCKASVVPVFAAEVAPARIRGSLVMNWQLFDAFGIFLGFSANLIVSHTGRISWRLMTASSALPTIILLALALTACPESPRFLINQGPRHYPEAFRTLCRLRGSNILAAKELLYTHYQMQEEKSIVQAERHRKGRAKPTPEADLDLKDITLRHNDSERAEKSTHTLNYLSNFLRKFVELFTVRRIRNATITASVCMISQQLCGINILEFYSSNIYSRSGNNPFWLSWGIGLTNFLFAFPAYYLIDRCGRRWLLLTTVPFLAVFMLGASLSYVNGSHNAVFVVFTYLFVAFYSWGMGPVPFTVSAEVFPLDHRVVGMSFAVFVNLLGAGMLTLFVPAISASSLHHAGLLGLCAGLNVFVFVLVFFTVRETAGATDSDNPNSITALALEELYRIFRVPSREFVTYQYRQMLPWGLEYGLWAAQWPFRRSSHHGAPQKPEPLYRWAEAEAVRQSAYE